MSLRSVEPSTVVAGCLLLKIPIIRFNQAVKSRNHNVSSWSQWDHLAVNVGAKIDSAGD